MGPDDERTDFESLLVAERPEPSAEFAAELDARAAEGFPRESALQRLLPSGGFRLSPALAGATTVVVAAAIAVSASGVLEDDPVGSGGIRGAEPQIARPPSGAGGSGAAQEDSAAAPAKPPTEPRKVARTADLALSTSPEELRDVADGVVDVTHRHDGFVARSNVSSGDGPSARADFDLMLPARDLQPGLDDLSGLAHVSSLTEGTDDITSRFTTGRDRIEALTEQRDRLRAKLDAAATPEQEAALRAQLRDVRTELATVRQDLAEATDRVRFTPVHVSIAADGADPDTGWSIGDALDDALRVLEVAVGVTLIAVAVALPVAALAGALWLAARAWVRRRRERALD